MNSDTQFPGLPSLTADFLKQPDLLVDNLFADLWHKLRLSTLLNRHGFKKRSGCSASEVVYMLLIWVWLKSASIGLFASRSLQSFSHIHKDSLYDFLAREDLNWRHLHGSLAAELYRHPALSACQYRAYVLDDSVKIRHGKKIEGTSLHFDHLTGRSVKGQQILTLGLATESTFIPIDSDIFISTKGAHPLKQDFVDGRSIEARRYRDAQNLSKPELAKRMMQRAQNQGIQADYCLADAWYGTKRMIQASLDLQLTPIFRMKKGKLKYRLTQWQQGQQKQTHLDAKDLYQQCVRKQWQRLPNMPYQACQIEVGLNLSTTSKEEDWINVQLLFVRGLGETDTDTAGKKSWALFLTTDSRLSARQILEIYALRWGIEVYFKEAKQHLGLLWEQTETFASHIASIHLTAMRYCLLLYAKYEGEAERVCLARSMITDQLTHLDFGQRLWASFRGVIEKALTGFQSALGVAVETLMAGIDQQILDCFKQVLQLDEFTLGLEFLYPENTEM